MLQFAGGTHATSQAVSLCSPICRNYSQPVYVTFASAIGATQGVPSQEQPDGACGKQAPSAKGLRDGFEVTVVIPSTGRGVRGWRGFPAPSWGPGSVQARRRRLHPRPADRRYTPHDQYSRV
jgi:hypothetical protein